MLFEWLPGHPSFGKGVIVLSHRVSTTRLKVCRLSSLNKLSGLGIQEELPVISVSSRLTIRVSAFLSAGLRQHVSPVALKWMMVWSLASWPDGQMTQHISADEVRRRKRIRWLRPQVLWTWHECCALHWHTFWEREEIPWWQLEDGARVVWDLWNHVRMPKIVSLKPTPILQRHLLQTCHKICKSDPLRVIG